MHAEADTRVKKKKKKKNTDKQTKKKVLTHTSGKQN